jgi:hypothetical protein
LLAVRRIQQILPIQIRYSPYPVYFQYVEDLMTRNSVRHSIWCGTLY